MPDFKMVYIFILGIFLSLLYYVEEMIEEQEYKEKSLIIIGFLALIKSLLGGILIVLIFYTLQELQLSFTLFSKEINFGLWSNLFIAGTISVFGSDIFKMAKKRANKLNSGDNK